MNINMELLHLNVMAKICHILNPVKVNESHDLYIAQPITFSSILFALEYSKNAGKIELISAVYNEDQSIAPNEFKEILLPDFSIRNVIDDLAVVKLPLLRDVLTAAHNSSSAEYIIFTNVDIAVQPNFYEFAHQKINDGLDGFIINRRRIPTGNFTPDDLPELYKIKGKSHPGFDCFVFKRELIPFMELGDVCVGIPFVEATLAHNLFALCKNFKLFDEEFLTFHLGMEIFKKRDKKIILA